MALLLVMVILILVATLATEIALTARTHWKLADHSMNDFLLRSVVDGRRHILLAALRYDQTKADGVDTEGDDWAWSNHDLLSRWGEAGGEATEAVRDTDPEDGTRAVASTTYRNRDVKILAWVEDERAKLNLRGLLDKDDAPAFLHARDTLLRLLDVYRDPWSDLDLSDSDAREMVEDLVAWLREAEDSEENPLHDKARGRLLSVDDLLRVPGGKWSVEILYDVRDPEQAERGEFGRQVGVVDEDARPDEPTDAEEAARDEQNWARPNGVPGLSRFVTVWNEPGAAPGTLRINLNTASPVLVRALLEGGEEEIGDAIVQHRRQGGTAADDTGTAGDAGDAGGAAGGESATTWFKSKADLAKVEAVGEGFEKKFPRLAYFADFKSAVFSLRIIATIVSAPGEGAGSDEEEIRDVEAAFQYREVVQRTQQGFVSLFAERRQDPILQAAEE